MIFPLATADSTIIVKCPIECNYVLFVIMQTFAIDINQKATFSSLIHG